MAGCIVQISASLGQTAQLLVRWYLQRTASWIRLMGIQGKVERTLSLLFS